MILIERYLCSQIALLAKSLRIFLNWTWRNRFFMMSCRISSNNFIKKKIKCFNLSLFLISITESWGLGKHSKSKFCVSFWYQNSVWKTSHFLMGFWMNYVIHSEKFFIKRQRYIRPTLISCKRNKNIHRNGQEAEKKSLIEKKTHQNLIKYDRAFKNNATMFTTIYFIILEKKN